VIYQRSTGTEYLVASGKARGVERDLQIMVLPRLSMSYLFVSPLTSAPSPERGSFGTQFAHRQRAPNWIDLERYSTAGKRCRVRHRAATLVTHTDKSLTEALAHP
jgi:hypothetical protein